MKFFHEHDPLPGLCFGIFGSAQERLFGIMLGKHAFGIEFR